VVSGAVLTAEGFDAGVVVPTIVQLVDVYPVRWVMEDMDYNGDLDLPCKPGRRN
jgi:hypothetical protein